MQHIAELCLEGLGRVRACTAVGRAAMTSDMHSVGYTFRALLQPVPRELTVQLETSLRLVDNYIKADNPSGDNLEHPVLCAREK